MPDSETHCINSGGRDCRIAAAGATAADGRAKIREIKMRGELESTREDMIALLHRLGPCEVDRNCCLTHNTSSCQIGEYRKKYLKEET